MRQLLVPLTVFASTVALAQAPTGPWVVTAAELKGVKNPVAKAAQGASAKNGEALYKTECASCHGETGKGDGADGAYFLPPPSNLTNTKQSDAELFVKITKGRGNMTAYEKKLDAAQRWDVVNFVKTLK
jgi:mono/diheme cytochrome c family protein